MEQVQACPQVSGIIALLLSKYPNLTYRYVKELISVSCVLIDTIENILDIEDYNLSSIRKWKKNKADRWFNRQYGFGLLQADKLLENANNFVSLGGYDDRLLINYEQSFTNKNIVYMPISDEMNEYYNSPTNSNKLYEYTIDNQISNYNLTIESVILDITTVTTITDIDNIKGLVFYILHINSDGYETGSFLTNDSTSLSSEDFSEQDLDQNLMSEAFRGESAEGTWKIYAGDLTTGGTSKISKANLSIIGH